MGIKSGTLMQTAKSALNGLHPPRKTLSLSGGSLKSPLRLNIKASPTTSGLTSNYRLRSSKESTVSRQAGAPRGKHLQATFVRISFFLAA